MTLEQKVKELCEKKGYSSRACRFQVIADLLGIEPDEAKAVESITRTIRQIFPVDKVGIAKEAMWHNTAVTREVENWDNIFKRTNQLQ
jgi:hypothetical protein